MQDMFCWYQTLIKTDLIDLFSGGQPQLTPRIGHCKNTFYKCIFDLSFFQSPYFREAATANRSQYSNMIFLEMRPNVPRLVSDDNRVMMMFQQQLQQIMKLSIHISDGSQVVIMGSAGLGGAPFISHTKYDNNNIGISPLNTIIMDSRKFFYFLIRKYWICCIRLIEVSSYFIAWAIS